MPLTTSFKERVLSRAQAEPEFVTAMLSEAVQAFLNGESNVGKSLLRNCINATIGFSTLADQNGIPDKSLQRMLGKNGNPQSDNLFSIIAVLLDHNNASLEVTVSDRAA